MTAKQLDLQAISYLYSVRLDYAWMLDGWTGLRPPFALPRHRL